MCDFKPGDEVVCVEPDVEGILLLDAKYTVRDVIPVTDDWGCMGVRVFEAEALYGPPGCPPAFRSSRFRKIERRKTDLSIESFLTIKPGQKEEPKRIPEKKKEEVK